MRDWLRVRRDEAGRGIETALFALADGDVAPAATTREISFDPSGRLAAMMSDDGIEIISLSSPAATVARIPGRLVGPAWSRSGNAIAALSASPDGRGVDAIVTVEGLWREGPRLATFARAQWRGLPDALAIDPGGSLSGDPLRSPLAWREDERILYFQLRGSGRARPSTAVPGLALWHSRDPLLPSQRAAGGNGAPSYLARLDLQSGSAIRLADDALRIGRHAASEFLIGLDGQQGAMLHAVSGRRLVDLYLVNGTTGGRDLVAGQLPLPLYVNTPPSLSPDGHWLLYVDSEGRYVARDTRSGRTTILTGEDPASFFNPVHFRSIYPRALTNFPTLQGWTRSGEVLLSDGYDIWSFPLDGRAPHNLTGNGRALGRRYSLVDLSATDLVGRGFGYPRNSWVDLGQPLYFETVDAQSLDTGLAVLRRPGGAPAMLHQEPAGLTYHRAARAASLVVSRTTARDGTHIFASGLDGRVGRRLTAADPGRRNALGSTRSVLVHYSIRDGAPLHGKLYLPRNYREGARYPTIVVTYSIFSDRPHTDALRSQPSLPYTGIDAFELTQAGYAVLYADVGASAETPVEDLVASVEAAVRAAARTGIVDADRLAVTGFSYGGFNTNVLITRTGLFRAAVSGAGISNVASHCLSINHDEQPISANCYTTAMAPGGPDWSRSDIYAHASPIFHVANVTTPLLIWHGADDRGPDFAQARDMFGAMRAAGKPVVLLEYAGEGHGLANPENAADLRLRIRQFYDHFLRDAPSPSWWRDGLSYAPGTAPAPAGN